MIGVLVLLLIAEVADAKPDTKASREPIVVDNSMIDKFGWWASKKKGDIAAPTFEPGCTYHRVIDDETKEPLYMEWKGQEIGPIWVKECNGHLE